MKFDFYVIREGNSGLFFKKYAYSGYRIWKDTGSKVKAKFLTDDIGKCRVFSTEAHARTSLPQQDYFKEHYNMEFYIEHYRAYNQDDVE